VNIFAALNCVSQLRIRTESQKPRDLQGIHAIMRWMWDWFGTQPMAIRVRILLVNRGGRSANEFPNC
jgi:hypothetical protein